MESRTIHLQLPDGEVISCPEADLPAVAAQVEAEGKLPAEIVRLFARDGVERIEPVVWPSELDASTTCRREVLLRRVRALQEEEVNMDRVWERFTGIGIEAGLASAPQEGWLYQATLPDAFVERAVDDSLLVKLEPGKDEEDRWAIRSEALGGALFRGRVDKITEDGREVVDWKVTGFPGPGRDWGLNTSWILQLQLYAHLARLLLGLDPAEQKLTIWRIYRDPYVWLVDPVNPGRKIKKADMRVAFKRFDLEVWDDQRLGEKVGPFVAELSELLRKLSEAPEDINELLADLPLDGEVKQMYGGKKCAHYCDVRELCHRAAGRPEF